MTPEQFQQIRQRADLSRAQLAKLLRIKEVKTIYRYEHGEREISGPVSLLMEMIDAGVISANHARPVQVVYGLEGPLD